MILLSQSYIFTKVKVEVKNIIYSLELVQINVSVRKAYDIRLFEITLMYIMSKSVLREKAKEFAKNIVFMTNAIKVNKKEHVLTNQLLRSGTSIGANIHEAQYAQGTADFISKLEIALKECYESEYWLELLFETKYLEEEQYKKLNTDCGLIRKC